MTQLNYEMFYKNHITKPTKLLMPKVFLADKVSLPKLSTIHFFADNDQTYGIDSTFCLLRGTTSDRVLVYNALELPPQAIGGVTKQHHDITRVVRSYYRTHLTMSPVNNLERVMIHENGILVINYSLIPMQYRYSTSALSVYNEWHNLKLAQWQMVETIGSHRIQFTIFKVPVTIPSKTDLNHYVDKFSQGGLADFYTNESFNILELWRIVTKGLSSLPSDININTAEKVILTFVESGKLIFINLYELLDWIAINPKENVETFYRFLSDLINLRAASIQKQAEVDDITVSETEDFIGDKAVNKLIQEYGSIGKLSQAEQVALRKVAVRYKTIPDPFGSGVTLDKMVVTPEDLKLESKVIHRDNITIHDKGMLKSSLREFDARYAETVMKKDIIQCMMKLPEVGVLIKDVKVKRNQTAVTKTDIVSLKVQPIAGIESNLPFTIPVIEKDGTFLSGGVRYRMDKQKGD